MSIIFLLVATILPIDIVLKKERKILQDRREIILFLHDSLQEFIWKSETFHPKQQTEQLNGTSVYFQFVKENEFIKGCATWQNVRGKEERICLYGLNK